MNKFIRPFILTIAIVAFFLQNNVYAENAITDNVDITINAEKLSLENTISAKNNLIKASYSAAENRFMQSNVKTSHNIFKEIIAKINHDDYALLLYASKMSELGFFDLSDDLISKLDNNLYTKNYIKDLKKYYYPSTMMNSKDILYFADAYANIMYNNLAIETTSELLNSEQCAESDYKNYLIALGFYKSNNLIQALKYINNATLQNDSNVNYKILKAKILADSKKNKLALKVLKEIQKVEFSTVDYQNKIKAAEEYICYKVAKSDSLKDYHLAYYYHLQDKSLLATKVLQGAILQAKQNASLIFGLLSHICYENNELLKAQEFANRAYKEDKKNYLALLTLANLNYDAKNYEIALNYYKLASKICSDSLPKVGMAKSYSKLNKNKKSRKIYEKLLKKDFEDTDLLIGAIKIYPQRTEYYLSKTISLDITNIEVWLGLTKLAINDKNYKMAETFLNNAYYIDENNFKYYYYLSLLLNAKGDIEKSKQALIKCSRLNSDYEMSIELESIKYEQ